jgi:peptidoglycan/LPS O-acetylase OafA/YrhL
MVGRFFRLYPVYLLALALGFQSSFMQRSLLASLPWANDSYFPVLRSISHSEATYPFWNLTLHLTLLHGVVPSRWISGAAGSFLTPAWSLSIEWQFYLIAPLLWAARRSWITWAVLCGAFFLCRPFSALFASPMPAFLPVFLPHFCIGIACAEVWLRVQEILPRTRWILTSAALLLMAVAVLTRWNLATVVLWILAFGCVARWWDSFPPARWCRTFLDSPVPQWLGSISYPLYLLHWPLLIVTIRVLMALREDWNPGGMLACLALTYLPASVSLAWYVHRWIEKPGMNLGRRLIGTFPRIPSNASPIRQ